MGFSTRLGTVVYAAPEILDAQARRHRFPSSSSSSAMVPMGSFVLCDVVSSSSFEALETSRRRVVFLFSSLFCMV
jgi:hypothetical protein